MADKTLEDVQKSFLDISGSVFDLHKHMRDLESQYSVILKSTGNLSKNTRELDKTFKNTNGLYDVNIKQIKNQSAGLQMLMGKMTDLNRKRKEEIALIDAIRLAQKGQAHVIADLGDQYLKLERSIVGVIGKGAALVSAFGAQKITWDSLIKDNLKYNKSLFDLTRQYSVSSRNSQNFSKSIQYIRKESKLSQSQFVGLADEMNRTFVGIKPDIQDVAQLIKVYGDQTGYAYDQVKKLAELQSQFPDQFREIKSGMEIIDKINKGQSTEADERQIQALRDRVVVLDMVRGATSEQMAEHQRLLTPLTEAEKELTSLLEERAKIIQSTEDLQRELAQQFEPIQKAILKTATSFVDIAKKYPEIVGTLVLAGVALKGFIGVQKLSIALQKAKIANLIKINVLSGGSMLAIGGIVTGLAAAATLVGKWFRNQKNTREELEKSRQATQVNHAMQKDLSKLSERQRVEYEKQMAARKQDGAEIEDQVKLHKEIMGEVSTQGSELHLINQEYKEITLNVDLYLKTLRDIQSALGQNVKLAEEFGGTNRDAAQALIGTFDVAAKEAETKFRAAARGVSEALKNIPGMEDQKIDLSGDPSAMIASMNEILNTSKQIEMSEEERKNLHMILNNALKDGASLLDVSAGKVKSIYSLVEMQVRQQEQFTSKYEARLDAERRLMESAQFGMGASVDMMQKQVDLAYELMQGYSEQEQAMQKIIRANNLLSEQDLKRVQSAKTQAEAQKIIGERHKQGTEEYKYLTAYAYKHQEVTKKIMDQQQKIYDLTKDIREGYLDAIREMSFGAGEFEKIIGTQDMGVTQLMGTVKDVTGEAKLNTMKLGGMQSAAMTAGGVGTDYAGQYTTGGARFLGAGGQEARNERIYKYGQYKGEAEAVMRGEVPGRRSEMGGGAVPGAQDGYLDPYRMEKANEDGSYKGVRDGVRDAFGSQGFGSRSFTRSMGVNVGVTRGGAPGRGDSRFMQGGDRAGAMGADILRGSPHHGRASGGYVPGLPKDWAAEWASVQGLTPRKGTKKVNDFVGRPGEISFMVDQRGNLIELAPDDAVAAQKTPSEAKSAAKSSALPPEHAWMKEYLDLLENSAKTYTKPALSDPPSPSSMEVASEEFREKQRETLQEHTTHLSDRKKMNRTRLYHQGRQRWADEGEEYLAEERKKAQAGKPKTHARSAKERDPEKYLELERERIDEKYKKLTGGKEVHNYVLGLQEMVEKTKQVREELEKNKVDEWHEPIMGVSSYNKSYQTYLDNLEQARHLEQRANEQLQKGIRLQQERDSEISGISVGYQGRKREDEREERETQERAAQEEQKNERKKIQDQMDAIRKKKMAEIHGVDESDITKFHSMGAINPYDLKDNQEYQDLKEKFTSLGGDYGVTFDGVSDLKDSHFYESSKKAKRRERERMDRDPEYERKVRTEAMDKLKEEGMAAAKKAISLGGGGNVEQREEYKTARKEAEEKFKKYRSQKHYLEKFEARQRGDIPEERTSQELSALGGQYVQSMGTLKGTPRERAMQARSRATRAGLGSGVHHADAGDYNEHIRARKDAYEHVSNAQAKDVALSGVSTIHTKRQGHTSAAAARGEEASAAAQAEWQERRHEAEVGGIGMDEGGAGGGQALITIRLEEGLKGQVEKAAGIAVQFESA